MAASLRSYAVRMAASGISKVMLRRKKLLRPRVSHGFAPAAA